MRFIARFSLVLLLLTPVLSHAYEWPKVNFSYGVGLRYGVLSSPMPLVNVYRSFGDTSVFFEGVGSVGFIIGNIGVAHKVSKHVGVTLSKIEGGSIGPAFFGYKLGTIYNSNEFNQSGWETSLAIYSITDYYDESIYPDAENWVSKDLLFPSISFGYQW